MKRGVHPGLPAARSVARRAAAAAALALGVGLGGGLAGAAVVGSAHDFINEGFSGGGVCAACHVPHFAAAGETRLWARGGLAGTPPARLCKDCHKSASPALPTGPGWDSMTIRPTPPIYPHAAVPQYDDCSKCHRHARSFVIPNDDCLTCHTTTAAGGVFDDATQAHLQIDRYFSGIGAVSDPLILSQHSIKYLVDGLVETVEPADDGGVVTDPANECKKCHGEGAKHPNATRYLAYPDDLPAAAAVAGQAIPKSADFSTYQNFCLACHDGVDAGPANLAWHQFKGSVPAGQLAPSSPANPAALQTAAPWVVPAVPPRDASSVPAPFLRLPPYFPYYETNGHGAPNRLIKETPEAPATVMNVSCLACHGAHGTQNRFLVTDVLGAGADTVAEFATGVCYSCHLKADLAGAGIVSAFHAWMGSGSVLHDAGSGASQWRLWTGNMNMKAGAPTSGVLPFYAGLASGVHARSYPVDLTVGTQWTHCLTCHDPHGTDDGSAGSLGGATVVAGMVRKATSTFDYSDLLCRECHVY